MSCPRHTLWGPAHTIEKLCDGIYHVTTAGHGGIYVEPELFETMPLLMKETPYSSRGWFEEDSDWCLPFIVFEDRLLASGDEWAVRRITEGAHTREFSREYHKYRKEMFAANC